MKKFLICFLLVSAFLSAAAQEIDLFNIDKNDLDSIFGEPEAENSAQDMPQYQQEPAPDEQHASILKDIRKRGIEFTASYSIRGGLNPGWNAYPWEFDGNEHFSWSLGMSMNGTLGINAQISEAFRVLTVFNYAIPSEEIITLSDFFLDYNFLDKVFLRAGKFEQGWGISPNFVFTNLLARVPQDNDPNRNSRCGPSYLLKFDVPIGVGGIQLLAMTRVNVAQFETPTRDDIGYGGKYNLAFSWADFNLGAYWQDGMPFRSFLSAKTTVFDFDLYNEWLFAVDTHKNNSFAFAFNFGFLKSFFNDRLDLNFEYFYNREDGTDYFRKETDFRAEGTSSLPYGSNLAFNILYRFKVKTNPRLFARIRYSADENSVSIIPGLRITPFSNMEVYFAVPMALGSKDGFYYKDSMIDLNLLKPQTQPRPFSFLLYVTFSGSVRASHYY